MVKYQAKPEIHPTRITNDELFADCSPLFRVYNDGRVESLSISAPVSPSIDRNTGVQSKDKLICPKTGVSARIFNPTNIFHKNQENLITYEKMAVMIYCHGGGFCTGSTFSRAYHNFLNRLSREAQAIVVSIEYRKPTKHPLPAAYNDCWDALLWVLSHDPDNCGDQPRAPTKEPWLEPGTVDFSRVYLAGDSAGANIVHHATLRAGVEGLENVVKGLILIQPFFWGAERIGDEIFKSKGRAEVGEKMWAIARWGSPANVDDPQFNPDKDPNLSRLGCRRVLVCVAEEDVFRDRGMLYGYALKKSGWVGDVVVMESDGENHAFQLRNPCSPNSMDLIRKIAGFTNNNPHSRL